ncbi:MAG: AzlC family ABC transporter permease [Synergistaceae bacterium]|nr:AzlC family ABC transporter permease [Synergistaceae bacterium]
MQKGARKTAASVEKGVRQAFPIVLGYAPIGTAYGLLAQQAGLGLWATLGMSIFVFAGASQFMAVSMIQSGVETAVIIGSTFMVNFRHVLMSASVAPCLGSWKTWQRLLLGGMLTDETFVLHSLNMGRNDLNPISAVTLNVTAYVTWATAGAVGYNLGAMIADPKAWGLDFALPAMFVGLLLSACGNKAGIIAAVAGGAVSVGLHLLNAGSWGAFLGALAGATAGVFFMKESKD